MCQEFRPQGGCTPLRQTPPWADTPPHLSHPPPGQTPLKVETPSRQTSPKADTPPTLGRHPLPGRHPLRPPDGHCSRWYASYFNAFLLVSTYVVCERLSVMHRQARLPEIFDQIAQNTPVLEFQADLGTLSILAFQNPLSP